jgi:hypothetical protein
VTPAKEKHPEPPEDARELKSSKRYYNATPLPIDLFDGSMLQPDGEVVIEAMDAHTRNQVRLGMLVEVKEEAK